ncbi:Protein of unknown function [Cotesia congregata]|uniref:Uncharacterized protein n=1 Tax=Cotesia congregata TaxID=51543 RepID=A0A8J2H6V4_COTCN|nr:Protein of unknown function [Cotesia congregata]
MEDNEKKKRIRDGEAYDLGLQEFFKSPERIINLDELGMSLCPKTGKVLGPKGEKNLYRIATGMENHIK